MQRQRENVGIMAKDCCGAISLMYVGIDNQDLPQSAIGLQSPDSDGDIVDHAETFAMAGKCVVESAADVEAETVFKSTTRGEDRSACTEPKASHPSLGVRNFQSHPFACAQRVLLEFI